MLGKLVSATARPVNAATGVTGVLASVFGVMSAFEVGLTERQESSIILAVSVVGLYLVGVTGSNTLRKIIGDPTIPSIEPGDPVPVHRLPDPLTTAPAPQPAPPATTEGDGKHSAGPWA